MTRATTPVRSQEADRLARHMADGCPSLAEAAYRMCLPISRVEQLWAGIRRGLGPQAR